MLDEEEKRKRGKERVEKEKKGEEAAKRDAHGALQ